MKNTIYYTTNTWDRGATCKVHDTIYKNYGTLKNNKVVKRPSVQMRLPMKAKLSKVKPKGWGDNAITITFANL